MILLTTNDQFQLQFFDMRQYNLTHYIKRSVDSNRILRNMVNYRKYRFCEGN
jgi:hypothetical protein